MDFHFRSQLVAILIVALLLGCERGEKQRMGKNDGEEPPVVRIGGTLRLSTDAQNNIDLAVETLSQRPVGETLSTTGWLVVRPGAEVVLKSPALGFVVPPEGIERFELGLAVKGPGQKLGSLQVLLTPLEQADLVSAKKEADILIRQSAVTLQRSEEQLERLKAAGGAVPGSRLVELQETIDRARAAYEEAQKKLPFLPKESNGRPMAIDPLPLAAPIAGCIVKVHVAPRQLVSQGDPLWTVADWSPLWIRVPVFEGDLPRLAGADTAQVQTPDTAAARPAKLVQAPQPTETGRRSVDLYYEIDNADGALRPGQAVAVLLPLGKTVERVVVPHSAVVVDGLGNNWVYVETEPNVFRRQQVELGQSLDDLVAVGRGLREGQRVVTRGAEALYGEEFKAEMPIEDEK
jgi:membrane fusion protein, heavy metal efflux system